HLTDERQCEASFASIPQRQDTGSGAESHRHKVCLGYFVRLTAFRVEGPYRDGNIKSQSWEQHFAWQRPQRSTNHEALHPASGNCCGRPERRPGLGSTSNNDASPANAAADDDGTARSAWHDAHDDPPDDAADDDTECVSGVLHGFRLGEHNLSTRVICCTGTAAQHDVELDCFPNQFDTRSAE